MNCQYEKASSLISIDYKDYKIIYNPLNFDKKASIVLLNEDGLKIFESINPTISLTEIYDYFSAEYSESFINSTLSSLLYNGIIFDSEKPLVKAIETPPEEEFTFATKASTYLTVTNSCNLACVYCEVKQNPKSLDVETGKKYLDQFIDFNLKKNIKDLEIFFFGGEPLANFYTIEQLIAYLKHKSEELNLNVNFRMITNGTLITEDIAKKLKEINLVNIAVSIDGLEQQHNKSRIYKSGKGCFSETMRGIQFLQEQGIYPTANVVINSDNINDLKNIAYFLAENNLVFQFMIVREDCVAGQQILDKDQLQKSLIETIKFARENLNTYPTLYHSYILDKFSFDIKAFRSCGVHAFGPVSGIQVDGGLTLCYTYIKDILGNIMDDNLDQIKIPDHVYDFNPSVYEKDECKDCLWMYLCRGGSCSGITKAYYGDTKKPSPYCDVIKAVIPELLKLEAEKLILAYNR